jgi:hypothetical protein
MEKLSSWESHWKDILENKDGSININQLKLELDDYSKLAKRMSVLTSEMTGGRLSYPTYSVKTILQAHEDCKALDREQQIEDDKEDGECSLCGSKL